MMQARADVDQSLVKILTDGECVAGGYLDIDTGKLVTLVFKPSEDRFTESADGMAVIQPENEMATEGRTAQRWKIALVALAAAELLQRSNGAVQFLGELLARLRRESSSGSTLTQEVMMRAESWLHIVLRSRSNPDSALMLVFAEDFNPGMALSEARLALSDIDPLM